MIIPELPWGWDFILKIYPKTRDFVLSPFLPCFFVPPSCPFGEGESRHGIKGIDSGRQDECSKLSKMSLFRKGKAFYTLHTLAKGVAVALAPGRFLWHLETGFSHLVSWLGSRCWDFPGRPRLAHEEVITLHVPIVRWVWFRPVKASWPSDPFCVAKYHYLSFFPLLCIDHSLSFFPLFCIEIDARVLWLLLYYYMFSWFWDRTHLLA